MVEQLLDAQTMADVAAALPLDAATAPESPDATVVVHGQHLPSLPTLATMKSSKHFPVVVTANAVAPDQVCVIKSRARAAVHGAAAL